MDNRRIRRISEEMKKELSEVIQNKIKDPRIPNLTSVSFVEVTRDLSYAYIGISVLANDKEKDEAIKGLDSAKGYIKKELASRIKLRVMPDLIFKLDDSIEKGIEMQKLISKLHKQEEEKI